MPRASANDNSVTPTRWLAADRARVAAGEPIAEIETERATAKVTAEIGGTLLQAAPAGAKAPIGAPLAYVGATLAAAKDLRRTPGTTRRVFFSASRTRLHVAQIS